MNLQAHKLKNHEGTFTVTCKPQDVFTYYYPTAHGHAGAAGSTRRWFTGRARSARTPVGCIVFYATVVVQLRVARKAYSCSVGACGQTKGIYM